MKERLIEKAVSINDSIHRNNLKVFDRSKRSSSMEGKQVTTLKNDVGLFARLYIGCQNSGGNLEEFFRHENQLYTPALSDVGGMSGCKK